MCCLPLAKRQPFQRLHWLDVLKGQSKRFERIGAGTLISTPPSLSIRSRKLAKSTITMWLTGMPVTARTVLIASLGPPN